MSDVSAQIARKSEKDKSNYPYNQGADLYSARTGPFRLFSPKPNDGKGSECEYKKQGVWVYYNNYGQAEAMGLYENGLKVGRWITGDLSGLHLSEKVCFMSNEEYFDWIAQYGGDLNFKEEFYNKGQLIQSNGVDTIRR